MRWPWTRPTPPEPIYSPILEMRVREVERYSEARRELRAARDLLAVAVEVSGGMVVIPDKLLVDPPELFKSVDPATGITMLKTRR